MGANSAAAVADDRGALADASPAPTEDARRPLRSVFVADTLRPRPVAFLDPRARDVQLPGRTLWLSLHGEAHFRSLRVRDPVTAEELARARNGASFSSGSQGPSPPASGARGVAGLAPALAPAGSPPPPPSSSSGSLAPNGVGGEAQRPHHQQQQRDEEEQQQQQQQQGEEEALPAALGSAEGGAGSRVPAAGREAAAAAAEDGFSRRVSPAAARDVPVRPPSAGAVGDAGEAIATVPVGGDAPVSPAPAGPCSNGTGAGTGGIGGDADGVRGGVGGSHGEGGGLTRGNRKRGDGGPAQPETSLVVLSGRRSPDREAATTGESAAATTATDADAADVELAGGGREEEESAARVRSPDKTAAIASGPNPL